MLAVHGKIMDSFLCILLFAWYFFWGSNGKKALEICFLIQRWPLRLYLNYGTRCVTSCVSPSQFTAVPLTGGPAGDPSRLPLWLAVFLLHVLPSSCFSRRIGLNDLLIPSNPCNSVILSKSFFYGYCTPELPIRTSSVVHKVYSLSENKVTVEQGELEGTPAAQSKFLRVFSSWVLSVSEWTPQSLSGQFVLVFDHTHGDLIYLFFFQLHVLRISFVPNCICCFLSHHHALLTSLALTSLSSPAR